MMKKTLILIFAIGSITVHAQQANLALADSLIRNGRYTEAENVLKTLDSSLPNVQTHYGLLYLNQNRYDHALDILQQALNGFLQQNDKGLNMAEALVHIGNVYRITGKFDQAEEHLLQALRIREQLLPPTHELIAATYNDLGLVYTHIDTDKSITYYEKALGIYQNLQPPDHAKMAIANTNLGYAYYRDKLYGDAITHYEVALKTWESIYPQAHPNKAYVLMALGQTYSGMRNQQAALQYYEKSVTQYEASQGKKHPDLAYIHNLLGNEKLVQQKFNEAIQHYQQAIEANVPDFNSTGTTTNPQIATFYNGIQLLYSLMYKAEVLESRYTLKTLRETDLTLALATLQTADTLIDKLRQTTTRESDKLTLGVIASETYSDGVRIAYRLSEVAFRNRKKYRELSFYFSEKSKSAVLQDAIADTQAKSFANIPAALLEEEKLLKANLALATQKLAQKPGDGEEKKLREDVFELNRLYAEFTEMLENQYTEYFNLKYNSAIPSTQKIRENLDPNTALISYFIDEKNNRLYLYTITRQKFTITSRALPEEFNKYITGLRNGIYFQEINAFTRAAGELYPLLIPTNIPRSVNDLVIIPTGRLSIVPFEALITRKATVQNFQSQSYLIQRFSIRYEFSAGLALQKKPTKTEQHTALLCAPVSFSATGNLPELPGTSHEVTTIANLFNGKKINNLIYLNETANETQIKNSNLKNYTLLHLATHGIVDESKPELSRIYLHPGSPADDGELYAGEIYNLELNADLVTLSACQTGLGKISKGEGLIGLSRALVYAGAQRIIVSYWSVADASTATLMTDFYTHWLNNPQQGYSEALRQAKLKLLQNGQYAAPYYWAPFVLIGF